MGAFQTNPCSSPRCQCRGDLVSAYEALLSQGAVHPDLAQKQVVLVLHELAEAIAQAPNMSQSEDALPWLERLRMKLKPKTAPFAALRGVYLWGDVGRGKSFLMDLFHDNVGTCLKRRVHFHGFMREVHERLHAIRSAPKTNAKTDAAAPLKIIARDLAATCRVLCLDELEVQDIGDAMIVGQLFEALIAEGVVVVTTSNRPPKDLYKDGLQREKFLPFIDLIYHHLNIVELTAAQDYRLGRLQGAQLYVTPLGAEAERTLAQLFQDLAGGLSIHEESLHVKGRSLRVPKAAGQVAWFDFQDLCVQPLGSTDYMEIAERYQTIILANVPQMTADHAAEARRFITLVDVFYDYRVKLVLSAEVPPDQLYSGPKGSFEFHRTVSRLIEMQAQDYIAAPHAHDVVKF